MKSHFFVGVIFGILLMPEPAWGQVPVSATASVQAEVQETCRPESNKKKCKPKPPEDDDRDGTVQGILGIAEVTDAEGVDVRPSRVTVWATDSNSRGRLIREWSGVTAQEHFEADSTWLRAARRIWVPPNGSRRVIRLVVEY